MKVLPLLYTIYDCAIEFILYSIALELKELAAFASDFNFFETKHVARLCLQSFG